MNFKWGRLFWRNREFSSSTSSIQGKEAQRQPRFHFVSSERKELNWLSHRNPMNTPSELRFVKNCLQHTTRRAGRHNGITYPFHFHFRTGKAVPIAPNAQVNVHAFYRKAFVLDSVLSSISSADTDGFVD